MSETYEDEHGVWEIRTEGGRTTTILIHPATPEPPAKKVAKKGAKKGAKKSASKED